MDISACMVYGARGAGFGCFISINCLSMKVVTFVISLQKKGSLSYYFRYGLPASPPIAPTS